MAQVNTDFKKTQDPRLKLKNSAIFDVGEIFVMFGFSEDEEVFVHY